MATQERNSATQQQRSEEEGRREGEEGTGMERKRRMVARRLLFA
jgi:hypothetical protein